MNLFVLAGIKSISNLFDGSFFVPYLLLICHSKKNPEWPTRCTACLYGMLSRIILLHRVATMLLPESECKGKAIFLTGKQIASFFWKKSRKNQLRSKKRAIVTIFKQNFKIHHLVLNKNSFQKKCRVTVYFQKYCQHSLHHCPAKVCIIWINQK